MTTLTTILLTLLVLWLLSAVYRASNKIKAERELHPAPPGARQRKDHAQPANPKWANCKEADRSEIFSTDEYTDWSIVSASIRPDGQYAVAIMLAEDPDFPKLWVINLGTRKVTKLDSTDLIDWPGERVLWPENDFSPVVFDVIGGYSHVNIELETKTFVMEPIERDESAFESEEWFVDLNGDNAYWTRFRRFADNTGQSYSFFDYGGPRYTHVRDATRVISLLEGRYRAVWFDESGNPMVDGASMGIPSSGKEEKARQVQALFNQKKIHLPTGDSEEEVGRQLRQSYV